MPLVVLYCVPLESVLGPIQFLLYTIDLLQLIKRHQLHPHAFANDTQIYGFCQPPAVDSLCKRVSTCVDDVSSWMRANRLSLNPTKTKVLWCSSPRRQHLILIGAIYINNTSVLPRVRSMHELGVSIDADIVMKACFAALRHVRPSGQPAVWQVLSTKIKFSEQNRLL